MLTSTYRGNGTASPTSHERRSHSRFTTFADNADNQHIDSLVNMPPSSPVFSPWIGFLQLMHGAGSNHVQEQPKPSAQQHNNQPSQVPPERMASHHHPVENRKTTCCTDRQVDHKRDGHQTARDCSGDVRAADDAGEVATGATPAREGDNNEVERIRCGVSRGGLVGAFLKLLAEGDSSCCNLQDDVGRTALHEAAEQGDVDVANILLSAGARIDPPCGRKATPLMLAARGGHGDVVRLLLCAGAGGSDRLGDECCRVEWRSTALHYAAKGGHVGVVSTLLDAGFHGEQHDEAGLTPAEISARAGHATSPAATRRLLGGGAGSNRGGKLVYDYVNMVAEDVGIVRGLVDGGPSLDWRDDTGGETALHRAAHFQHFRITEVLLRAGADVNLRNVRGGSPLHVAASTGCAKITAALLEAGANQEARMDNGRSPLHLAVINNKPDAVLLLLRAGASTEHRDFERGQTPLSEASEYSLAPIIRVLLEAGADLESRSTAGLTSLHWACRFNSPDSVAVLLAAGADPEAVEKAAATGAAGTAVSLPSQPPRDSALKPPADVIGLGDPSRRAEDPRRPFMGEAQGAAGRRLDPAARSRIAQLLHHAKRDRAWRRRGWLVVLVKRRDDDARASVDGETPNVAGVVDDDSDAGLGCKSVQGVNVPQGRKKRTRVGAPQKAPPGVDGSRKGALAANDASPSAVEGATSDDLRLVGAHVNIGADGERRQDSAGMLSEKSHSGRSRLVGGTAVEALVGLASVEIGVFRNVLGYI